MEALIQTKDLHKHFKMGSSTIRALNGIDLKIYKGEVVCILGTSGSGKSTLLNVLAGLEKPSRGEIIIGNIHLERLSEEKVTKFRQLNIGFVFQSYNLIPTLTAKENVALGLTFKGIEKKERNEMAEEMLIKVGLKDRVDHLPSQLSGGQQQRVSIARAFVDSPKIVYADEPTGNLDSRTSKEIMDLMTQMAEENDQTLIIVTHDEESSSYANRIIHIIDGRIDREIIKSEDKS